MTAPIMTKTHYEYVAALLCRARQCKTAPEWARLVADTSLELEAANPFFKSDKFIEACYARSPNEERELRS